MTQRVMNLEDQRYLNLWWNLCATYFWCVAGPWVKGLKPKLPLLIIPEPCRRRDSRNDSDVKHIHHKASWSQRPLTEALSEDSRSGGAFVSSYPDLVVYELAGQVHLLGGASDGEDPGVGVSGGGRVSLQLHVSSRLLVNTLDGFPTCT